jgi:thiosulfate/3-mercaptopyruvate sulfurtransferase
MNMLVSTAELSLHLNDPAWVIFDCRHDLIDLAKGERVYREGHIPGAHFANLDIDLSGEKNGTNGRHPLPSPAAFTAFLARHGVTNSSTVIAYDDAGGPYSARLWWLSRWIGLSKIALLDGGIQKWTADGHALSRDIQVPQPAPLQGYADTLMVVSADDVKSRLNDDVAMILIDARAAERYRGDVEPIDPVAGHIPGAHNRFFKDNLNADLTMRSANEINAEFSNKMGHTPAERVVHQCGSGVTACANIFAMEYAGLKGSKLYAGSWSEWVSDPSRPVAKGVSR